MRTFFTFIAVILSLGAAAVAGYGYYEKSREIEQLRENVAELEARILTTQQTADILKQKSEKSPDLAGLPKQIEKDMADVREKVEGMNTRVEVLGTQVNALREADKKKNIKVAKIEKKLEGVASGSPDGTSVRKEDIEELIEEKMKGQEKLGKEPQLSAVAARLDLDESTQNDLERVLRQKKNEMMELLRVPRSDGTNMLDDFGDELVEIFTRGKPDDDKARQTFVRLFQRLAVERVPGTEKTYLAEIIRMQEETRNSFKEALSEDQFRSFEMLGVQNAMDIKIPNEPIEIYLQQKIQAAGGMQGEGK